MRPNWPASAASCSVCRPVSRDSSSAGRLRLSVKIAAGLFAVAMLLSAAFLARVVTIDIWIPVTGRTPEQEAAEFSNRRIREPLFFAAFGFWLATGAATAISVIRWFRGAQTALPEAVGE